MISWTEMVIWRLENIFLNIIIVVDKNVGHHRHLHHHRRRHHRRHHHRRLHPQRGQLCGALESSRAANLGDSHYTCPSCRSTNHWEGKSERSEPQSRKGNDSQILYACILVLVHFRNNPVTTSNMWQMVLRWVQSHNCGQCVTTDASFWGISSQM